MSCYCDDRFIIPYRNPVNYTGLWQGIRKRPSNIMEGEKNTNIGEGKGSRCIEKIEKVAEGREEEEGDEEEGEEKVGGRRDEKMRE